MMKHYKRKAAGLSLAISLLALVAQGQQPAAKPSAAPQAPPTQARSHAAPPTTVTVDGNEAMFTTMCALLSAGFEADVSADNWTAFRAQMRDRMQQQQGPAVDALRQFYEQHELPDNGAMLSNYLWYALVAGPAPKFQPTLRREELPPEVLALEGFSDVLSNYYKEQKIGQLWRQVQPIYSGEIERLHDEVSQVIFVTGGYLREMEDVTNPRSFNIIVEPLVGRITNVRNFGDHYATVPRGANEVPTDVIRHAYLHFLMDPLPQQYSHVVAVKRPLYDMAARAPRLAADLKDDYYAYFAECLVRATELKLQRMSPGEREAQMDVDDADGYVLVRPLFNALARFEQSEPSMRLYFPDMVRSIDVNAELKRVSAIQFASGASPHHADDASSEEVARRREATPTTVPNDADAIAALTEGERRIAEKNPRAAEASFKRVLVRYPDQTRAWYGLGLVALMDHDGERAKEVFGRLTTGEHAATKDPMVLAWSHVYLGRVLDAEGQSAQAKTEYQSALAVQGGPDQARQAAQKGLQAVEGEARNPRN
jgi:tetratricopeptide (TPR) repeat protein